MVSVEPLIKLFLINIILTYTVQTRQKELGIKPCYHSLQFINAYLPIVSSFQSSIYFER